MLTCTPPPFVLSSVFRMYRIYDTQIYFFFKSRFSTWCHSTCYRLNGTLTLTLCFHSPRIGSLFGEVIPVNLREMTLKIMFIIEAPNDIKSKEKGKENSNLTKISTGGNWLTLWRLKTIRRNTVSVKTEKCFCFAMAFIYTFYIYTYI